MALPKIDIPIFELELPSNKTKIKYRPFLIKEKKILLLALESKDMEQIELATKQILNNCIISPEIDIEELPSFDVEYIFLQIRSKSIGETVDLIFHGYEDSDCEECQKKKNIRVDISKVKVKFDENHTNKIQLTNDIGIVMRYLTLSDLKSLTHSKNNEVDTTFNTISKSISVIFDKNNVYDSKDFTQKEIVEFLETLSLDQYEKIEKFFETIPKITHVINIRCSKCNREENFVLEGLNDFFE